MKPFSLLISRYLLQAVLPYFIFSWVLLTVVVFIQQAARFSDIFFNTFLPSKLVWQLTFALIPNVIAFTCPMAVLVGVIIGLSKMQGDSELVAIRAAGVGNLQITVPILILGILLSIFAFFINLKGVPLAAQIVRQVALQTAIYKLESPIEPGVFNSEIGGFTVYVKNGNIEKGTWENIFIYNEDKDVTRLITSKSGRIDMNKDESELVLENAVVSTFPADKKQGKLVSERVGEIRFGIKTKREEVIDRITNSEKTPEELGLRELAEFVKNNEGKERIEAGILWQRRLILSATPLIFALLGTALVLRFNRGGRGFGIFLALVSLVAYYLIALLGEQLARTGTIRVQTAGIMPIAASIGAITLLFLSNRLSLRKSFGKGNVALPKAFPKKLKKISRKNFYIDLTTGILDFDIISNVLKYFLLTVAFLSAIFVIFTAFELWKFAGAFENGVFLLGKYLLYLFPFIYIQLAPSAVMIAVLATYIIKSRQNEIVTWTAAGRSVYRLLLPCFLVMVFLGLFNWTVQEKILPNSNRIQDVLREQIRKGGIMTKKEGKLWVANENRIFSFEMAPENISRKKVKNLSIYEFSENGANLQTVYKASEAVWGDEKIKLSEGAEQIVWSNGTAEILRMRNLELDEKRNPFGSLYNKPAHLNAEETLEKIKTSESETEQRSFEIALEKKYATLLLPFIITLFTAPFAMSLSRKSKVVTVGYAVVLWLLFMGISNVFEQFGLNGSILPEIAVWSPLLLFSILGVFLLSKVKT